MTTALRESFPWGQWISLYCVLSFAILGLDAGISHRFAFHDNAFTYTPVIFAPLAIAFCAMCAASYGWRRTAWFIGLLALIVGGAGTFFHLSPALFHHGDTPLLQAILESRRPIFAPAAFASTGLLMLLVNWGSRRDKAEEETA